MKILGIETSCDETAAAIISLGAKNQITLLSNEIASSIMMHKKTGGIIPENAAREQIKYILPVIDNVLRKTNPRAHPPGGVAPRLPASGGAHPGGGIDAIAVTVGPGLIGSLLVGVETAKTLSFVWNKPLIPVNHLVGHIYANWIGENTLTSASLRAKRSNLKNQIASSSRQGGTPRNDSIQFPAIALVVSGGHTDLVLMKGHGKFTVLGATRDDAAGEAFDKIGRLLGLPYPAGPTIEKLAKNGDPKSFRFPCPMIDSADLDFSFSGLKTAVLREVKTMKQFNPPATQAELAKALRADNITIANICASVQQAIIDVLVTKTIKAAKKYEVKSILLGGGVAANQELRKHLKLEIGNLKFEIPLSVPPPNLCTDNAAMIASAAAFNFHPKPWKSITADPELYFA